MSESSSSVGGSMSLDAQLDALADELGRVAAGMEREYQHERDLRAAEHRAVMAEWNLRLAAVADLERRLAERLGTLKDGAPGERGEPGRSVALADVEPMIDTAVEKVLASWERPKDGKSVSIDELAPLVESLVTNAVAGIPPAARGDPGPPGRDFDPAEMELVRQALARVEDGLKDIVDRDRQALESDEAVGQRVAAALGVRVEFGHN